MPRLHFHPGRSLLVKLGGLLGTICALAVFAIATATIYLDSAAGKGGAINLSGSLRKFSYQVELAAAEPTGGGGQSLDTLVDAVDARLSAPALMQALPQGSAALYDDVVRRWRQEVMPAAREMRAGLDAGRPPDAAQRAQLRSAVESLVGRVDTLTSTLETGLDDRIANLRLIQGAALFVVVALVLVAMFLIRTQVMLPLGDLLRASRAVRERDFDVRVAHTGLDELGQVGSAFNAMVTELRASYATLEARVEDKTAALAQTNHSLQTLYSITRTLSENPPDERTLSEVLDQVRAAVGLEHALVCSSPNERGRGFPIVVAGGDVANPAVCSLLDCGQCHGGSESLAVHATGQGSSVITVPLREGGRSFGVMPLAVPAGVQLSEASRQLLATVGQHLGAALANARRLEDERRLTVLEERGVIARELHDSLAQSLSYLKIQVSRLAASLPAERSAERAIVDELRTGLNNAYRQLRELLTTFRLRIGEHGFGGALDSTIAEFGRRSGTQITLDNQVPDAALSAQEQIHVLQIVREALSNVEHHARASNARVSLKVLPDRQIEVLVDDDGVGIAAADAHKEHHYGRSIMHDRAATLGGGIAFSRGPLGGTRVALRFTAASRFAAPAARGMAQQAGAGA